MIIAWHRGDETSKRLDELPGVGPALATALVASVADPRAFRSGRDFSAWIGLVPKQSSSGGKQKLGSISKQGDRYLRGLFTAGALAVAIWRAIDLTLNGSRDTSALLCLPWHRRQKCPPGVHHHLILPIDTVAVRPATRSRSGGTSSSLIRTGMRCARRTQLKVGLTKANSSLLVLRF
jgi:hypothetical protein